MRVRSCRYVFDSEQDTGGRFIIVLNNSFKFYIALKSFWRSARWVLSKGLSNSAQLSGAHYIWAWPTKWNLSFQFLDLIPAFCLLPSMFLEMDAPQSFFISNYCGHRDNGGSSRLRAFYIITGRRRRRMVDKTPISIGPPPSSGHIQGIINGRDDYFWRPMKSFEILSSFVHNVDHLWQNIHNWGKWSLYL